MRRLVADKGELGEDHSECNGNQRLQPGVVEEDQPGHRITQRGQQTSEEEYNQRARPLQPGLRTACQRQAGVWGHSVALGACPRSVRRRPNDRSSGPLSSPALAKSAGFRSTLKRGIRSAVIIPMRQQPDPMLIFRLTEDRRSRLDVGRHGGNPHSRPGAPVTAFRRHQEQLKNTRAVRGHTFQQDTMSVVARERSEAQENVGRLDPTWGRVPIGGAADSQSRGGFNLRHTSRENASGSRSPVLAVIATLLVQIEGGGTDVTPSARPCTPSTLAAGACASIEQRPRWLPCPYWSTAVRACAN
jgi:hypothetical protein